ncbi:MAG: amidohydrolase family protein [Promethearchaeota archaeon]
MKKFIDAHVHCFPDKLFRAIWNYFINNYWDIKYQMRANEVIEFLMDKGAKNIVVLNYAHRPNISRDMNDWTFQFSRTSDKIIGLGTIHPDDKYFHDEIERILSPDKLDLAGIKLQILVTNFKPNIPKLEFMYEKLIEHDKVLVMHVGTGPAANEHVGIKHLYPVLECYPELKLQIPHLGAFEYQEFFDLAREHDSIYFDTAMMFIDHGLFPDNFIETMSWDDIEEMQDRIMFGSDFPNIPYDYSRALASIAALPVKDAVKDKIFLENAEEFYSIKKKR